MSELENLQKQLAECHDPKKQMALMTRIKKLEKELGIRPASHKSSEDRMAVWEEEEVDGLVAEPQPGKERKTGLSTV